MIHLKSRPLVVSNDTQPKVIIVGGTNNNQCCFPRYCGWQVLINNLEREKLALSLCETIVLIKDRIKFELITNTILRYVMYK
jgi:hypothetical protein